MSSKSWHLDRRTFLRGTGAALAIPWLECMSRTVAGAPAEELPRRMCGVFFPFGVSLPGHDSAEGDWHWFPRGTGRDFRFTKTLESLEPLRGHVSVLSGLSHAAGRSMGGHDTGDIFLTGTSLKGATFENSVSLDQLAAERIGGRTRFGSLTLSSDGGVGEPTRSTTLSYDRSGRPVPAQSQPARIFARLFGREDGQDADSQRNRLQRSGSMLDLVLEHSRSLRGRLGSQDRRKFDEYLASVRSVEERVEQARRWLEVPKPVVDPASVALDADPKGPEAYLAAMYDLIFLAFQTDSTRLATFQIGQVAGATTIANAFPACIGLQGNWHGLAHGAGGKGGAEKLGRFDRFLAGHLARFLQRLHDAREGDDTLLDRTLVLYGSSNSRTHQNRNYPLVLAGGDGLGLKHGRHHAFTEATPLANLFVTMLDRLAVPVESFADSTGEMSELLG